MAQNWGQKGRRPRPAGHSRPRDYWGESSQPARHQLQCGKCFKLRIGVRGGAPAAKLFSCSKGNFELSKKSAKTYGVVVFRARFIATSQYAYHWHWRLALSYGRHDQWIISTCDDSVNTNVSHSAVTHLRRNEMYSQMSAQWNDLQSQYYTQQHGRHQVFRCSQYLQLQTLTRSTSCTRNWDCTCANVSAGPTLDREYVCHTLGMFDSLPVK